MPALRRKRRRFPLLPQLPPPSAAKGNTGFASVSCPCRCPYFLRFKHSPDFSGIQSESVPALRPTARPHIRRRHACPRPYRNALSPSPLFRKKPRIGCPANLLENDFPPGYLFCQPFISQNLRIILTHNHRRRCGNDFIADARSATLPADFLPNLQPLMSPSAGYPTAPPPARK